MISYNFWRDIAFYITPKLYKKNEFWRNIAFYIAGDNTSGCSAYSAGYYSAGQIYDHQVQTIFWTSAPGTYPAPCDQQSLVILDGDLNNHGTGSYTPITIGSINAYGQKSPGSYSIRFVKDNAAKIRKVGFIRLR